MLACGTLAELGELAALPVSIRIVCAPDAVGQVAGSLDGKVTVKPIDDRTVELGCPHRDKMSVLRRITNLGDDVLDVDIHQPRLDEIYAHLMAGDSR